MLLCLWQGYVVVFESLASCHAPLICVLTLVTLHFIDCTRLHRCNSLNEIHAPAHSKKTGMPIMYGYI